MSCDVGEVKERLEKELYLHHSSFSNPSVASPTSQFILQHLFRFSYVTSSSLNSPGEPPMTILCSEGLNFLRVPRGALPGSRDLRIPDLKFFSTLFWLNTMGLVSGRGSVTPTNFNWRKETPFEE